MALCSVSDFRGPHTDLLNSEWIEDNAPTKGCPGKMLFGQMVRSRPLELRERVPKLRHHTCKGSEAAPRHRGRGKEQGGDRCSGKGAVESIVRDEAWRGYPKRPGKSWRAFCRTASSPSKCFESKLCPSYQEDSAVQEIRAEGGTGKRGCGDIVVRQLGRLGADRGRQRPLLGVLPWCQLTQLFHQGNLEVPRSLWNLWKMEGLSRESFSGQGACLTVRAFSTREPLSSATLR